MALETLDLAQLRALDMLLRERSVTRAAARLNLSQPALSHALGRLRELTGDPLFVRTPRGVTPTPRAEAMAPELSAILLAIERVLKPQDFDPATLTRTFVIGCADFVELRLVRPLLARLAKEAPSVDLLVRPQSAVSEEDLAAGRADLLIAVAPPTGASLRVRRLEDEGFSTVARRHHPAIRRRLTLAKFVELHHIQIAPRGLPGGPVDDALAGLGLSRRVVLRVPSFLPAFQVVATSELLLTAPTHLVADATRGLPLVVYPTPVAARPFRLHMIWHERAQRDPAHAWLRERALEALGARATPTR